MTVFFHGSFGLRRKFMAGIVQDALERPGASDAELAKHFGYGAPFATKYRYWLHKTGIAELGRPLELTEMGHHESPEDSRSTSLAAFHPAENALWRRFSI